MKTIVEQAKPLADAFCEIAEETGGTPEGLLRACRKRFPTYCGRMPKIGSWEEVIAAAEGIRWESAGRLEDQAIEATIVAKAICLSVSRLKSPRRRLPRRVREETQLDWTTFARCRLCHRLAPCIADSIEPYCCSVHRIGSSAYKYAQRHKTYWGNEVDKRSDFLNSPADDYRSMFRLWLGKWFPAIAARYAATDAAALIDALNDAEAPPEARQEFRSWLLAKPAALTAFLIDAEAWLVVDPVNGGVPQPRGRLAV
jgi:hypothetical protein